MPGTTSGSRPSTHGRIVELGLSFEVVADIGWDVLIDYWWQPRPWPR